MWISWGRFRSARQKASSTTAPPSIPGRPTIYMRSTFSAHVSRLKLLDGCCTSLNPRVTTLRTERFQTKKQTKAIPVLYSVPTAAYPISLTLFSPCVIDVHLKPDSSLYLGFSCCFSRMRMTSDNYSVTEIIPLRNLVARLSYLVWCRFLVRLYVRLYFFLRLFLFL